LRQQGRGDANLSWRRQFLHPRRHIDAVAEQIAALSLPPLEFCFGTSPIQAARSLLDLNAVGSGTDATMALGSTGPTPGTSSNRRPRSVDRAVILTRRSLSSACSFTS
jgi:hypothetical protein